MNLKILLVEDDVMIIDTMNRILTKFFGEVKLAENGQIGLKILEEEKDIDLIITDIDMPIMSGLDMIEHIKSKNIDIPIYITSGSIKDSDMERVEKLNVNKFMQKPIEIIELIEDIKKDFGLPV